MGNAIKSDANKVTISHVDGQDDLKTTTEFLLKQSTLGASSVKTLNINGVVPSESIGLQATKELLETIFDEIKHGKLDVLEEMLFSQAFALNMAFSSLAARANRQNDVSTMQMLMNLCLKAQNQSRATLEALVQLKKPSNTTFVKQANIANNQQVNNGTFIEKNINPQNELLESINERLDSRKKIKAKRSNSQLEALD
jgi:hypothetical protein